MHYRGKSLLIELGAQTNTVEEIMNACDPLAHILSLVLAGEASEIPETETAEEAPAEPSDADSGG